MTSTAIPRRRRLPTDSYSIAFPHHPSLEPFLDQPQDSGIGYAMLHELEQPTFVEFMKESSNVGVKTLQPIS